MVAALAARQFGVVSAGQLRELGWTRSRVSDERLLGRIHRVHQGVYAVGHPALTSHGRCQAAVLACGRDAILSHFSAAWVWGFGSGCGISIDITAPGFRHARPGIRVHSASTLATEDVATAEDLPVTAPPRTLLDVAATAPKSLPSMLDKARQRGLLDLVAIDSLLVRSRGRRGVAGLRRAVAEHREPAMTRSGVERRFLGLVSGAGLPRPQINLFVAGFELDAYWPDLHFAVELDTYRHHGDRRAFERDRFRQEQLKLSGVELIRITGTRIENEPRGVVDRLRIHLDRRSRELLQR